MGYVLMCLALVFHFAFYEALVFSPEQESALRSYIDATMKCRHVPGMTLAVVKKNDTWTSGFGYADIANERFVNERTLFNIGSVTKTFTSTLLAGILREKGFTWDSKLSDILGPAYKFTDDYRTKHLTLKDILCHRTGLAAVDIGIMAGYPEKMSREKLCKRLKYLPEVKPIRDVYSYNNYLYMLAGHVAEVLLGKNWETLVAEKLFEPIGMSNSSFLRTPSDLDADNVAKPYISRVGSELFENGTRSLYRLHPVDPAGSILSSASDMAKWIRFILRGGRTEQGTQAVDRYVLRDAFNAHVHLPNGYTILQRPTFPADDVQVGYGYGWFTSSYRGFRKIWHTGGFFSYTSKLWIFPNEDIGIFVSVNGPGTDAEPGSALGTVCYYIADMLLGETPWLNETTSCTYPEPWRKLYNFTLPEDEIDAPEYVPEDYTGKYGNYFLPDVQISQLEHGQLKLVIGRLSGILHAAEKIDIFKLELNTPWEISKGVQTMSSIIKYNKIYFARDNGEITHFDMQLKEINMTFFKGRSVLDAIEVPVGGTETGNIQSSLSCLPILVVLILLT